MKKTEYIEMSSRNSNMVIEQPVRDEKVLVMDIDYCLYHSPEMEESERAMVKNEYLKLSEHPETTWLTKLRTCNLFREVFFHAFGMHPSEFCRRYDIPDISRYVDPDPELRFILKSIPHRKFCFTNGSMDRAARILKYLDLEDLIEAVICTDVHTTEFIAKPHELSYQFVERYLGTTIRSNIYFFDDSPGNVASASSFGWNAVRVSGDIKTHLKKHIPVDSNTDTSINK